MPVERGRDSNGPYYRWGEHGKKYYYEPNNERSRKIAEEKAARQGRAIKASQARAIRFRGGSMYLKEYQQCKARYLELKYN